MAPIKHPVLIWRPRLDRLHLRDPVLVTAIVLLLVVFAAGLVSQSQVDVLLGKSLRLWFITLASGWGALGITVAVWRFQRAAGVIKRIILLGLITLIMFEGAGFLSPKFWPVSILQGTPVWVQDILPDSAFERANYRQLRLDEIQDDAELGFRYGSNLDVQLIWNSLSYREITDINGFANLDETLYDQADVVVTGDSFTQGWGVELNQSWPQTLSHMSGLRVLNLGMSGWHVYQYPRVLKKFASDAYPTDIVVTLTSFEDLIPLYYQYADNEAPRSGTLEGWIDLSGPTTSRWYRFRSTIKQNFDNRNFISLFYDIAKNAAPFSTTAAASLTNPVRTQRTCEFTLNGARISLPFGGDLNEFVSKEPVSYLDRVGEDLATITEFAAEIGARVYFIYLPYPEEIYVPLLGSATDLTECTNSILTDYQAGRFDFHQYLARYQEALGPDSDLLFDATPFLQGIAAEGEQLSWSFNEHPNPAGHQAIAEFVSTSLEK